MPEPDASPRYGRIDEKYALQLAAAEPDDDGPIWMLNLMKYRDRADYADGRETTLSGREADDLYSPLDELAAVGAEIVYVGEVDTQFLGKPEWDRVAVVKYPTRRSFLELQSVPGFAEAHAHKEAGMEQTIIVGCLPMPEPYSDMGQTDWADVPFPPTADDGPVQVLHVTRFDDTDEAVGARMRALEKSAIPAVERQGGRVTSWFEVGGTIIGDGRSWDQVRINTFPSRDAVIAVVFDVDRLKAYDRRDAAAAYSFNLILRPVIDRLAESIEGDADAQ